MKKRLPLGIQTFRTIREEGCYYVDKTAYAARLVDEGVQYFLSRPRRFGKSLFADTLKELFEGNEALFDGLYVHERWDWSVRHPVVRLDFSAGNFKDPDYLRTNLMAQLGSAARRAGLDPEHSTAPELFSWLLEALHDRTGQRAVVIVDEYDKPMLDALAEPAVARSNRDPRREGARREVFYRLGYPNREFAASGLTVTVEDSGSGGRLDMAVRCDGRVNLFGFKVVEQAGAGAALAQLRARGYADKYRALGEPIHLVGVEFSRETRNVVAFETAPA